MKAKWFVLSSLLIVVFLALGCAPAKAPAKAEVPAGYDRIRIVGGSLGGKVTVSAMAFATLLNKHYPEIEWSSNSATIATNPVYLTKGDSKLAITNTGNYVGAYGLDKVPESRLRSLNVPNPPLWYVFIIPEDKPWTDISQVPKGLTLNPGTGSSPAACEAWLGLAGLSKKDFNWVSTGKTEMGDAWRVGKLDLIFISVAGPDPILVDMMTSPRKIKAMGLSPAQVAKAKTEKTFEALGFQPPEMSNLTELAGEFFKADVLSTGQVNFLASRDDFPEGIAYKIAKITDEHIAELTQIYVSMKYATPQLHIQWAKPPFSIHPGVAKYYREKGYLK